MTNEIVWIEFRRIYYTSELCRFVASSIESNNPILKRNIPAEDHVAPSQKRYHNWNTGRIRNANFLVPSGIARVLAFASSESNTVGISPSNVEAP